MKLIIAILRDRDAKRALDSLIKHDFRVTFLASTGGYLRRGNSTLLIGTREERLDEAADLLRKAAEEPASPEEGKGVFFVLDVARFDQI